MIYDYHVVFGSVSILLTFCGYALYFRSIFSGKTKPHPFTWFLFLVIDTMVFIAQVMAGAGPGAWALGIGTILAAFVFLVSLRHGERDIKRIDWACLVLALTGVAAWYVTSAAIYAVVLASVSDALAKVPTIRKSYIRPHEESPSIWTMDVARFSLSIVALSSITWTTALFPVELISTNAIIVLIILIRRRQLGV